MKRIYIITTAHSYDDKRVTHRIARSFVENGFDVSWFGTRPKENFKPYYNINFHFFESNYTLIDRIKASVRLNKILRTEDPADVYFAVDPDSINIANNYAKKYGKRSVFDIHEIFHKDMVYRYAPHILVPLIGFFIKSFIRRSCKNADLVIGVGQTRIKPYLDSIRQSMIVRHCVPSIYVSGLKAKPFKKGFQEIRIVQGLISQVQGTYKVLLAAKKASNKTSKKVKIVLFRIFSTDLTEKDLEDFITKNSLEDNVILLDPVPYEQIFPILCSCDVGVISYQRIMGVECMPNRVFEYMAVGLPCILPSYAVEMQTILENYNCGISMNMENPDDIADGISFLITNPDRAIEYGENGYKGFIKDCNWEIESRKLLNWLKT